MNDSSRVRVSIVGVVVAALFCSLLARLWFLQVNESGTIVAAISQQTLRTVRTEAPRGVILDRNGLELVTNRVSWVISADPKLRGLSHTDPTRIAVLGRLSETLCGNAAKTPQCANVATLTKRLDDPRRAPVEDAILATDVSNVVRTEIVEHASDYAHLSLVALAVRRYPYRNDAAQVLGYIGRVNADDLKRHPDYGLNDTIGRAGVEAAFEAALRGVPSSQTVLTNPAGQVVGDPVRQTPAQPGHDVRLTIDVHVQDAAQRALAAGIQVARTEDWTDLTPTYGLYKYRATGGSVVVLDTTNGDVLAAASNPDYDPNISIDGFNALEWGLLNSKQSNYPLIDRATSGLYAPGSTFKLVSSFAAVAAGVRGKDEPFDDQGCYQSTNSTDKRKKCNASNAVYGRVALQKAITVSSDAYFYSVGDALWGVWKSGDQGRGNAIQKWARIFGFDAPTGIALSESSGRIPDATWRRNYVLAQAKRGIEPYKSNTAGYIGWNPGDNMNTAVGQGDVLVTPLQLADAYAAFANGGTLWQPRLADAILDGKQVITKFAPRARGQVAMAADVRDAMLAGFQGAVQDTQAPGTAAKAFQGFPFAQVPVAGKTGTAQVGAPVPDCIKHLPNGSNDVTSCKGDTSWFAGMFGGDPSHPRYVIVVNVEEGGRGGNVAAPIARQIIEAMMNVVPRSGPIPNLTTSHD